MPTGNNFNFNPAQSQNNFGFAMPQLPQLQSPATQFSPQNFGFQNGTNSAMGGAMDFSLSQTPTQADMSTSSQAMFDQGNVQGNMPQAPQSGGMFDDFSGMDTVNAGIGIAQLGAGLYFQNKQLNQGQQRIDLTRDKYNNYLANEKKLDTASNERNAKARQQLGFGG